MRSCIAPALAVGRAVSSAGGAAAAEGLRGARPVDGPILQPRQRARQVGAAAQGRLGGPTSARAGPMGRIHAEAAKAGPRPHAAHCPHNKRTSKP